jgi:hypothetical protein
MFSDLQPVPLSKDGSALPRHGLGLPPDMGRLFGVFSASGFHLGFATKPVSSEVAQAERLSDANHGSI